MAGSALQNCSSSNTCCALLCFTKIKKWKTNLCPSVPIGAFLSAHRPPTVGMGDKASWSHTGAPEAMQSTDQSTMAWLQLLLPHLSTHV